MRGGEVHVDRVGMAAVAVDLGQAYAKRAALQSNVDLAVLAAAAHMTKPGDCGTTTCTSARLASDRSVARTRDLSVSPGSVNGARPEVFGTGTMPGTRSIGERTYAAPARMAA